MKKNRKELSKFLKKIRKDKVLLQREVAARVGLSAPFISALERGKADTTIGTLYRIVDSYGYELHIKIKKIKKRKK